MRKITVRPEIMDFAPYVPGLTIEQIQERYGLTSVIKLASNENPLGTSPLVMKAIERNAARAFRYPENHTPRLTRAVAENVGVPEECVLVGNGSVSYTHLTLPTKRIV